MRYKVKWRVGGEEARAAEIFDTEEEAKERVRQLLADRDHVVVDVWNEQETWQIVSPAGVEEWSRT